ncbi:MAG: hypothetical protein RL616_70 [Verrucomicrobiota bacterium]|jgi:hypothetical protein
MKNLAVVLVLVLAFGILALLVFGTKSATQLVSIPAATNSGITSDEMQKPILPLPGGEGRGEGNTATTNQEALTTLIRTNLNSLVPAPPEPPPAESAKLPPLTILDNARVVIHNYQDRFGENPVGDNSEITAALTGKNPKQVTFITEESCLRTNDKGELLDGWGTPFFFHQVSSKEMEIRSAGEDRKLWTFDDLVTR